MTLVRYLFIAKYRRSEFIKKEQTCTRNFITITIYGRDQSCGSCVAGPRSTGSCEWTEAAPGRKYASSAFQFEYIDMDQEQTEEKHQQMIAQMEEEDYLYPLVLLNGDIVAEGIPQLKPIYRAVEEADPSLV